MDSSRREVNRGDPGPSFGRRLRQVRMAHHWSQMQLAQRMRENAVHHGGTAALVYLKMIISKWECEIKLPNEHSRRWLAESLGITVADLGQPENPDYMW
jgi:transcriptional regulator with XRE-family HTH domain